MKRVAIGLSGGVDSAISAFLLKKKGFDVVGVFMKNWDEIDETGYCSAAKDREDVHYVCSKLGIPFHEVNFVKDYWSDVFSNMLTEYQNGLTPNPDIMCNRFIKFDAFLKHCFKHLQVDAVATGHYAKTNYGPFLEDKNETVPVRLLKAADVFKDQTFFLSQVSQDALKNFMFPVGSYLKEEVKQMAHQQNLLRILQKRESTGICFIGKRNFQSFISNYLPSKPGPVIDLNTGLRLKNHDGLHMWTIGQRVPIPGFPSKYFVARKCPTDNILYVVPGTDHPILFSKYVYTSKPHWINMSPFNKSFVTSCDFRFQHTKPTIGCRIFSQNYSLLVELERPLKAITPGQYAVFYNGNECLGSSKILAAGPSLASLGQTVPRDYKEYHHSSNLSHVNCKLF